MPWEAVEFIDIFAIQVEQGPQKTNFRLGTSLDWLLDPMTSRGPFWLQFFCDYKYACIKHH